MRKIKILFYLIILFCLIIIINSNWAFVSTMYAFDVNLYIPVFAFAWPIKLNKIAYHFPPAASGVYLLGCFILGILLAYFKSLMTRFKGTRQVKTLEADNKSLTAKIADLQKEVDFLQRNASKPSPPRAPVVETPANTKAEVKENTTVNENTAIAEEV